MRRLIVVALVLASAAIVGVVLARLPEKTQHQHQRTVYARTLPDLTIDQNVWLNQLLNQIEDIYVGENVYLAQGGITADECVTRAIDAMRDRGQPPGLRTEINACLSALVLEGAATTLAQKSRIKECWLAIMMGTDDEDPWVLGDCKAAIRENGLELEPQFAEAVARVDANPQYQMWRAEVLGNNAPMNPE